MDTGDGCERAALTCFYSLLGYMKTTAKLFPSWGKDGVGVFVSLCGVSTSGKDQNAFEANTSNMA